MQQFYIQVLEFKTQTRESSETLTFLFLEIGTSQVAVNCRNGNQQTMILVANNVTTSTPTILNSCCQAQFHLAVVKLKLDTLIITVGPAKPNHLGTLLQLNPWHTS